jgi:MoxR-like ATPase
VWDVFVDTTLQDYIVDLVTTTRLNPDLALGASPRASLALFRGAQALAAIQGRDHAIPDDIQRLAPAILTHRVIVSPESDLRGFTAAGIVRTILSTVPLKMGSVDDAG